MNLASPRTIKQLLVKHGTKPRKGLGQNFLIDRNVIRRVVSASCLERTDTVLEIGPGVGTLTQELARCAKRVIAVEKDAKMVEILHETLENFKNVEIIHGDALKMNVQVSRIKSSRFARSGEARQANPLAPRDLAKRDKTQIPKNYKVVANLPYYITAPVIRKFLESSKAKPYSMTLIVQKEVAQRICAKPPKMSILAVSVQFYATPKIISYVKKTSFWPQPKVDAAILQVTPFSTPYALDSHRFFRVVKAGFTQPRKQLLNNLSKGLGLAREAVEKWLVKNNISPTQRAETLTVQDWGTLANDL